MERPASFDEAHAGEWELWALDNGLPELPVALAPNAIVPVARWAGPKFGAVVCIWWRYPDEDNDEAPFIDTEIVPYRRTADGWEEAGGSGGSNWIDPPFERAIMSPRAGEVWFEQTAGASGWLCTALEGFVGTHVRTIRVADADGVTERPVESPLGAFVVAVDSRRPATISFLDRAGDVVATEDFPGHADWG